MKYEIGDYVSKPVTGICKVENIMHLDLAGVDKNKLYYMLTPINGQQGQVYVSVETAELNLRKCMTAEEAWKLIERIPEIGKIWIDNEKMREREYKEAVKSNNPEALVSIIKMTYQRNKIRLEQGKKCTTSDERYFHIAENLLYSEMGVALGKSKQEICQLILDFIDKKNKE